jgi:hypothetical protein
MVFNFQQFWQISISFFLFWLDLLPIMDENFVILSFHLQHLLFFHSPSKQQSVKEVPCASPLALFFVFLQSPNVAIGSWIPKPTLNSKAHVTIFLKILVKGVGHLLSSKTRMWWSSMYCKWNVMAMVVKSQKCHLWLQPKF